MDEQLENELRKLFKVFFINILKNIGPKSKIKPEKLTIYEFEDGLYFNEEF